MSAHRDFFIGMLLIVIAALILSWSYAYPFDGPQWKNEDPAVVEWYQKLMRPDAPESSCCGLADAYWCDEIHVVDAHTSCTITDDRPDAPLNGRPHVPIGTVIDIPNEKLKWDKGNPTGHAVVFLGRNGGWSEKHYVFCFVQSGGT